MAKKYSKPTNAADAAKSFYNDKQNPQPDFSGLKRLKFLPDLKVLLIYR